jgi:hypothetical protein
MTSSEEVFHRFFGKIDGGGTCFWSRAGYAYRDGLARMAELEVDDPFGGASLEATLVWFCEQLLEADRRDVRALWSITACDVICCSNSITESCWTTLLEVGDFEPRWLVEYSYWVRAFSGKDTAPLLADVLQRHGLLDVVRPTLLALREPAPTWVDRVLAMSSSERMAGG